MKASLKKRIIYKYFKPEVFLAAQALQKKLEARRDRIQKAIAEMRRWSEIPFSYQNSSIARILGFTEDQNIINLMRHMYIRPECAEEFEAYVPLNPQITLNDKEEAHKAIHILQGNKEGHIQLTPEKKQELLNLAIRFLNPNRKPKTLLESLS